MALGFNVGAALTRALRAGASLCIASLAMTSVACAHALPRRQAEVTRGMELVGPAIASMAKQGVVFAPYDEPIELGVEETDEHYRCIEAVNEAVLVGLASEYKIVPARKRSGHHVHPASLQSPGGPRVAVRVEGIRCGLVLGEKEHTSVTSREEADRDASRSMDDASTRGEVVLKIHDRSTGQAVLEIRAQASGAPDGIAAARLAAESAIAKLYAKPIHSELR
jgi:hypothetical protein